VVAGRCRDHAFLAGGFRQVHQFAVGPAKLEGENRLQILALDEHTVANAHGQTGRRIGWRFDRYVIDGCVKNFVQVFCGT
jgi:hypothetical protein